VESNRAFGIYAAILAGGILSVITASVMAGVTALPSLLTFVEHVGLSLLFRAAYKSFDGPYHVLETLRARRLAPAPAVAVESPADELAEAA